MSLYNDQKTAVDRVGKKLVVKSESVESPIKIRVMDEYTEDPYLEVARENMSAVESSNRHE